LSTTELFKKTSIALGRVARLIPVPSILLITFAKLMGKSEFSKRLCGSLQVDITKTKKLLGWFPPKTVDESLQKTADFFIRQKV
jgi:nucleoside-diphosphate-sugar epimerase